MVVAMLMQMINHKTVKKRRECKVNDFCGLYIFQTNPLKQW